MDRKQSREITSLKRAQHFTVRHASTNPAMKDNPVFVAAQTDLAAAMADVAQHASEQYAGMQTAVARTRDIHGMREELIQQYLEPLRGLAEEVAKDPAYRLTLDRFRVPNSNDRKETVLAAARGMLSSATEAKPGFLAQGMHPGLLDHLAAAIGRLEQAMTEHTFERARALEAKTGLRASLDRARVAVKRVDIYVRTYHRADQALLAAWDEIRPRRRGQRTRPRQQPQPDTTAPDAAQRPAA